MLIGFFFMVGSEFSLLGILKRLRRVGRHQLEGQQCPLELQQQYHQCH